MAWLGMDDGGWPQSVSDSWHRFSWAVDVTWPCISCHNWLIPACLQSSGHRVPRNNRRESKPQCTCIFLTSAGITFSVVPLAKACHMASLTVWEGEDCLRVQI